MTSEITLLSSSAQADRSSTPSVKTPRVWPGLILVGVFWVCYFTTRAIELTTFVRFISSMAICAALTFGFVTWWLLSFRRSWSERLVGLAAAIGGGIAAAPLCMDTLGAFALILMVPPYVFTVWAIWLLASRKASPPTRLLGLTVVLLATWGFFALLRFDGISGDQRAEIHWRWTPTAGELYLQERAQRQAEQGKGIKSASPSSVLSEADWPGFRGLRRDGVVRSLKIALDWKANPPQRLWKQRVGPGWSSIAVVGNRLFTQEQRGQAEAVVCLNAATGQEIWSHEDTVRFWEKVGGEGPRATPEFADGCIYALGATGILNCLDADSGERRWFSDIAADSGAKPPTWGFCCSPLVVQGVVVVFAGGDGERQLLAYRVDSGQLAWYASVGSTSYSSAQRAEIDGVEQILFWSGDRGLTALDPASGTTLWRHDVPAPGAPRSLQPHIVGPNSVLISSETDLGTALLDIRRNGDSWNVSRRWQSKKLQPSFNDFVIHNGSIFGFDGATFCCVDLQTGIPRWKEGRYGHGQVVLLSDSSVLLVAGEKGQVVLLEANPEENKELGRFQAIEGKTWNHPAVSRNRLFVRNGEEIACYELALKRVLK
jgi:outer membrane protein assembly factor BamB